MIVTLVNQEDAVDTLVELESSSLFDIGCASITVGSHPTKGRVIIVVGSNDRAAVVSLT